MSFLTIIIPAYNEESRLPSTLESTFAFIAENQLQAEVLVVDDGSSDGTVALVTSLGSRYRELSVISLPRNQGKGAAVREGMAQGKGDILLYMDADGATPIAEYLKLQAELERGADVCIGSRALPDPQVQLTTHFHRKLLGRIFNTFVNIIAVPNIADTQCGFKLFTKGAADFLFSRQSATGFSFDVEILLLAQLSGMRIKEIPVNWHNVKGSKVNLVLDSAKMLRDIIYFRFKHRHSVKYHTRTSPSEVKP